MIAKFFSTNTVRGVTGNLKFVGLVTNIYIYVATFHFASAITINYWDVVAIDSCMVTIQSSFTVNTYMFLLKPPELLLPWILPSPMQ